MQEHAARVPHYLWHGGDLIVASLGLDQSRVHGLQASEDVVPVPDVEMVPATLRLKVLDVESDPGPRPRGLHHPGALHVGGVVPHSLRQPALRPVLSELDLAATQVTLVPPPAVPALALVTLPLAGGGRNTVTIVTTITDCSLPQHDSCLGATLTGGTTHTTDHNYHT